MEEVESSLAMANLVSDFEALEDLRDAVAAAQFANPAAAQVTSIHWNRGQAFVAPAAWGK